MKNQKSHKMKKQILALMVSTAVLATSPAFGMDSPLDESQTTSLPKLRLQNKLEKLDDSLKAVQARIREEVECFNVGGPEGGQLDPRISAIHAQQQHIRGQIALGDR